MTKVKDVINAIEAVAPLKLQDEWDNSGLQVGFTQDEVKGVLVCLDITEEIVDEAIEKGCTMIVSHHPLLFHALKQVSDSTYQQRCVAKAITKGLAIYSAHTSLDNARGGVNFKIAELIGLRNLDWLEPKEGMDAGSGLIGELAKPTDAETLLNQLKDTFKVKCLKHTEPTKPVKTVALCGGAGAFLMQTAARKGADCFITGEFHYHDYFDNDGMLLVELGHYQSEQYTKDLLKDIIVKAMPGLRVEMTEIDTNPTRYR
ncbi:MAG: Nif3-like dinuclear metal center hexameric protein [Bacteroidales bacterium]|nr:Nif3-like dinuclear metal center hexameric protein [Bacteroidales bacterium]